MSEKEVSPIDLLLDENNSDNITLYDENGDGVEFEQIAVIPMDEKVYAILRPIEAFEGMKDDEALVFNIEEVDDEEVLVVTEDDKVIDKVFDQYYEMLKAEGIEE